MNSNPYLSPDEQNENPFKTPEADVDKQPKQVEYVGFWLRVLASIIDTVMILLVILPTLTFFYGANILTNTSANSGILGIFMNYIFPPLVIIVFWIYKSATPGKMIINAKIVDAKTLEKPSNGKLVVRYFCYYISILPLLLGFLWVAWDSRKQGFHDKIAGTLVIKNN